MEKDLPTTSEHHLSSNITRVKKFYNKNFVMVLGIGVLALGTVFAFLISQQRTELASEAKSSAIIIPVLEDAYVSSSNAKKNYGYDKEVKVDEDRAGYLKFDLGALSGKPVDKATLRLYITNSSKSIQLIKGIIDNSWNESTVTYAMRPQGGDVIGQVANATKNEWKDLDITPYVTQNSGKMISLLIDASRENKNNLYFGAKESANAPVIIVQTTESAAVTIAPTAIVSTQVPSNATTIAVSPTVVPTSSSEARNIRVTNPVELTNALANAQPGDVITLADGTYALKPYKLNSTSVNVGKQNASAAYRLSKSGTPNQRIVLQGSRNAILDGNNDYGLHLFNANNVDLKGFTVINGSKGIMLDGSSNVIIDGVEVKNIAMEGIHLRTFSSNNEVKNSYVHHTGRDKNTGAIDDQYGEGIYVGTANSNWGTYTGGKVDTSDNNNIINNRIEYTGGEGIDVKEGTSNGLIENNTFDNAGIAGGFADSWLDMKGNNWIVRNNKGINALKDGYQVHGVWAGWGNNNTFLNNTAANVKQYGFWVQNNVTGNKISCTNTAQGAPSGLANVPCTN